MQRQRSSRTGRRPSSDRSDTPSRAPSARTSISRAVIAGVVVGIVGLFIAGERLSRPRTAGTPGADTLPLPARPGRPGASAAAAAATAAIVPARPDERELTHDAEQLAESLARDFAGDGRALAVSGRVLQLFVAPERGRTRFEQATATRGGEQEAWLGLAELAWHDGDYPRAAECMARLEAVAPRVAREKAFLWVDSLVKSGDGAAAVTLLGRFADAGGGEETLPGWAQVLLGQARAQTGDHAGAVAAFDRVAADPAHRVVAVYSLAQAWSRLGDPERAREARDAYAAAQHDNLAAFDRAQQTETTTRLDDKYPVLAGYHCEAGSLYARANRFDEAVTHWRRAAALAPDWPEPRRFLELLAAQEGR